MPRAFPSLVPPLALAVGACSAGATAPTPGSGAAGGTAAATDSSTEIIWRGGSIVTVDDAVLGRHPTTADLDKVSSTIPIAVIHISAHFSVVDTAGLTRISYTAATKDPGGGSSAARPGAASRTGCSRRTRTSTTSVARSRHGPRRQQTSSCAMG